MNSQVANMIFPYLKKKKKNKTKQKEKEKVELQNRIICNGFNFTIYSYEVFKLVKLIFLVTIFVNCVNRN